MMSANNSLPMETKKMTKQKIKLTGTVKAAG
jgi:hypothetical protein